MTAFQTNAFQSDAFQQYAGVLGDEVVCVINSTEEGDSSGIECHLEILYRFEIGGVPTPRKDAKREREELLDEVIGEVLAPAPPSQLPEPLKPVLRARPVLVHPAPKVPLTVPPALEIPDDTEEIIAALTALGLF